MKYRWCYIDKNKKSHYGDWITNYAVAEIFYFCQCSTNDISWVSSRLWQGRDLNPRPRGYEPHELPDCSTLLDTIIASISFNSDIAN